MDVLEYDNKVGWRQVLQNKQKNLVYQANSS